MGAEARSPKGPKPMAYYVEVRGVGIVAGPFTSEEAAVDAGQTYRRSERILMVCWRWGNPPEAATHLDSFEDVPPALWDLARSGDVVLVALPQGFVGVYAV